MSRPFEVGWTGDLPAGPAAVWDAVTRRTAGWLWPVEYESRAGGSERGLGGGTVTVWEPPSRFTTRSGEGSGGGNELDYRLEPRGSGTHLRYTHRGTADGDYDREVDACRRHTNFYYHSLVEYVRHFAGRDAVYVTADGPEASARGGSDLLRRALGVSGDVAVGDRVRLTPAGLPPIDGVVDYATPEFLGVRTSDALYRWYGRDAWGWPVGLAHHLFGPDVDGVAAGAAWNRWLTGIFASEEVA
ncbi:SRPBCC domain-containing protein [Plantactinospora sp. GCM10030261]|uniref:SRPBCC family protein n=1 Tax=Plantactinospora sp. GCM10030261 TaxID=3273420 RepID=UPI00360DE057